eukprot:CAMPEP_0173371446 /NCGR_PEP_ID=MMETSP1144-20121109/27288_1 /TAXON_ID=483371 /ORGANISM="non described non described, Strain CCMP2298" /LENGTH=65 /DNA_ID=CAMNT_0014323193 /DNA_START=336 /DNA_END=533 /DNA_ORIENTATION=-
MATELLPFTLHTADFQSLPANPVDLVGSMIRSSQEAMEAVVDRKGRGVMALKGARMVLLEVCMGV